MKIVIKRLYFQEDYTVGCLQVVFSGRYESRIWKGLYFCDTLEPHAIPWQDNPWTGEQAGERIAGKTAIPEGTYKVELHESRTHKRPMPFLLNVPEFKRIVLRTGKSFRQTHGDILVGKLKAEHPCLDKSLPTFNILFHLISEAITHGEDVTVEIRSFKGWKHS